MDLRHMLREVPDFPKPGINFIDITPILSNPAAFAAAVDGLCLEAEGRDITQVAGIESRGFIFGAAVALRLGVGFIPIRKPGKLPCESICEEYALEYGTDRIEMHTDACGPADRIFLIDDLLATGGTMAAAIRLVEKTGASVAHISFVVELSFLKGRMKFDSYDPTSLVTV
jgi:adenine phosphoribosyltransferase